MNSLVQGNFTRAATFFALAFGCMAVGGFLLGTPRIGVQWGFALGILFAVFAFFFVRPTEDRSEPLDRNP